MAPGIVHNQQKKALVLQAESNKQSHTVESVDTGMICH